MAARDATHFQFQNNPKSCTRQVANMPQPSIVPPLLNPSATAANRFFERRSSRTTRTCGSPNTPRTLAAARKPANEYPSDSRRRRFFDLAIPQHAKIERTSNLKKAFIHTLIWRYGPLKSPTRFPEDPDLYLRRLCGLSAHMLQRERSRTVFVEVRDKSQPAAWNPVGRGVSILKRWKG
jgi:hypothetical protein